MNCLEMTLQGKNPLPAAMMNNRKLSIKGRLLDSTWLYFVTVKKLTNLYFFLLVLQ